MTIKNMNRVYSKRHIYCQLSTVSFQKVVRENNSNAVFGYTFFIFVLWQGEEDGPPALVSYMSMSLLWWSYRAQTNNKTQGDLHNNNLWKKNDPFQTWLQWRQVLDARV